MMWWYGSELTTWGYVLMTVSMVLFWGLLIFGVTAFIRYLGRTDRSIVNRPTAEQVLAGRFARGEIAEQEYRQRLDTLRGSQESQPFLRS